MITIFTIPKPFHEHNGVIQRNAIKSWIQLKPKCEIILFGDDDGVAEAAEKYGATHISSIEKNEFGTPLLSSAFRTAQQIAKHDITMYVNSDIIFLPNLMEVFKNINPPEYLICGRRWDLDVKIEIDFSRHEWVDELSQKVTTEGKLHGLSGIDYFIFRRNSITMPPFAVGRPGWDTWLIYEMRQRKIPVINASEMITAIHQNHDFSHSKFGEKKRVGGPEWSENIKIAGGLTNMLTLRDADWILTKDGIRRPSLTKRIFSSISVWYPWRLLLATKRQIQKMADN